MQEWMGCCLWVHENKGKTLRSRDFLACDPERTPYHWGQTVWRRAPLRSPRLGSGLALTSPWVEHSIAPGQSQPSPRGSGNFVMSEYAKGHYSQRLDWWLVRFRRQLPLPRAWHLRRDVRHINKIYVRFIANATGQEREHLAAEWAFEKTLIDERHRGLETERLQKQADRFYVPLPLLSSDHWERGPIGTWYLTPEGAAKVRSAIYEQRKRRQEIWVPWIAATVGVIGVLTGLILALTKG